MSLVNQIHYFTINPFILSILCYDKICWASECLKNSSFYSRIFLLPQLLLYRNNFSLLFSCYKKNIIRIKSSVIYKHHFAYYDFYSHNSFHKQDFIKERRRKDGKKKWFWKNEFQCFFVLEWIFSLILLIFPFLFTLLK